MYGHTYAVLTTDTTMHTAIMYTQWINKFVYTFVYVCVYIREHKYVIIIYTVCRGITDTAYANGDVILADHISHRTSAQRLLSTAARSLSVSPHRLLLLFFFIFFFFLLYNISFCYFTSKWLGREKSVRVAGGCKIYRKKKKTPIVEVFIKSLLHRNPIP